MQSCGSKVSARKVATFWYESSVQSTLPKLQLRSVKSLYASCSTQVAQFFASCRVTALCKLLLTHNHPGVIPGDHGRMQPSGQGTLEWLIGLSFWTPVLLEREQGEPLIQRVPGFDQVEQPQPGLMNQTNNVHPILINPCSLIWGCPRFSWGKNTFVQEHPHRLGFINMGSTLPADSFQGFRL